MNESRRVLLIAYQFPPVGGAGVQRAVKFVKYLPGFGWRATVLTVANPSVPVLDRSLAADVPAGTEVRRARTFEPGYALKAAVSAGGGGGAGGTTSGARGAVKGMARRLANLALQPDPQVLWRPCAVREGMRALRAAPHAAIMATGPPFSSFLVAARLARRSGLPLLLDYRDEWGISNAYLENKRVGPVSRSIQGRMQAAVVRRAGALVATTEHSAAELRRVRDDAGSSARVDCIYNGYDPADFAGVAPAAPPADPDRYRLAYVGTLWNLTDVAPLVDAVLDLAGRRPDLAARLDLTFAGRRTAEQDAHLGRLAAAPCRLTLHPYLDHAGAVALARSSDALCVLLSDLPDAGRVVPAKLFESMAARVPILSIAPPGEVWDLLEGHPAAGRFVPGDVAGIADHLEAEVARKARGDLPDFAAYDASRFDRRRLTGQLACLLDAITIAPGESP
jgi:glycosyltransferase involved in cell wall biosynthesis